MGRGGRAALMEEAFSQGPAPGLWSLSPAMVVILSLPAIPGPSRLST